MENTAYNRQILEQVKEINSRFLNWQQESGKQILDSNLVPLIKQDKGYDNNIDKGKEGAGFLDTITSLAPLAMLALGKPEEKKKTRGRPKKGGIIKTAGKAETAMSGNVDKKLSGGINARPIGSGKSEKEGAGFFEDLGSIAPLAMLALGKPKKGRKSKKGGAVGVDSMSMQQNLLTGKGKKEGGGWFDDIVGSVGNAVKTAADVAPSALALAKMMKGRGTVEGAKKSPWVNHVKQYAKKNKMKYGEALKDPKCKSSYRK